MKLPFHIIMQLLDTPFNSIQAPVYPVQNFEHKTEVARTNFLRIKHATISVNKTIDTIGLLQHVSNIQSVPLFHGNQFDSVKDHYHQLKEKTLYTLNRRN